MQESSAAFEKAAHATIHPLACPVPLMALDILHLRQEDWRAEFGVGDLQRGQGYAAQGRSRLLSLKDSTLLAS